MNEPFPSVGLFITFDVIDFDRFFDSLAILALCSGAKDSVSLLVCAGKECNSSMAGSDAECLRSALLSSGTHRVGRGCWFVDAGADEHVVLVDCKHSDVGIVACHLSPHHPPSSRHRQSQAPAQATTRRAGLVGAEAAEHRHLALPCQPRQCLTPRQQSGRVEIVACSASAALSCRFVENV